MDNLALVGFDLIMKQIAQPMFSHEDDAYFVLILHGHRHTQELQETSPKVDIINIEMCCNYIRVHACSHVDIYMRLYPWKLYIYVYSVCHTTKNSDLQGMHALKKEIGMISNEVKSLATALLSHGCKVRRRADDFRPISHDL